MKNTKQIPPQFIVRIAIRNEAGAVVGEREYITYNGLLAVAHEMGLDAIETSAQQMPSDANGQTAVVRAVVKGKAGTFTGLGDASPHNVNRKVARHLLRVAETRAKARALRDLCNISMLALEELGAEDEVEVAPEASARHAGGRVAGVLSDNQKRALWRKAKALGHHGDAAHRFLAERLGCDPGSATREQASRLLDKLTIDERTSRRDSTNAAA